MAGTPDRSEADKRQMKLASIVLVVTMGAWLLAQMLGGQYGWPIRFALLFDLMALAGFVFALVVTARLWLGRRN